MDLKEFKAYAAEDPALIKVKEQILDRRSEVRESLYVKPDLRHLFFELTLKCNERCFHCGSGCEPGQISGLSLEKYAQILDDVDANFDKRRILICITGGEPMIRSDFFDIVNMINDKGFAWGMTSNATLITKDVAHKLREAGMKTMPREDLRAGMHSL